MCSDICPCREVVTFNHFLEAAAEKEVQGKARLQDFIENLLQRVELAEKQLEYYQSQQADGLCRDISEHVVSDTGPATKCEVLEYEIGSRTEAKGAGEGLVGTLLTSFESTALAMPVLWE